MSDENVTWITVNGSHIPVREGQDKNEAMKEFFKSKGKETFETKQKKMEEAKKASPSRHESDMFDLLRKADRASESSKRRAPLSKSMNNEPPGGWNPEDAVKPTKESQARMDKLSKAMDRLIAKGGHGSEVGNLAQKYANERKKIGRI
jgi:hypothetical protein